MIDRDFVTFAMALVAMVGAVMAHLRINLIEKRARRKRDNND